MPAASRLQEIFPEYRIVGVPAREVLLGGGNIHCITQQIPAGKAANSPSPLNPAPQKPGLAPGFFICQALLLQAPAHRHSLFALLSAATQSS
jgi:hypothetical protein